jgi:excisionase family DNA binding protein
LNLPKDKGFSRSPRCLGCLNFTGFAPACPPDGFWDPDQEEEHLFTCKAYPEGIPEEVLSHRKAHHAPLPGQQGDFVYSPREAVVSVVQAAGVLGASASTVRRWLRAGLLWGVRARRGWLLTSEELRTFRRPGTRRRGIPPGFFRPS